MAKSRIQPNYEHYTDEQCAQMKIQLLERKLEALRVYRLARETMFQVNEDYDRKVELIDKSREKLKRQDSNHRGMD